MRRRGIIDNKTQVAFEKATLAGEMANEEKQMLTVICDAVEHEKRQRRPCVAIRAYRKDFAPAGHSLPRSIGGNERIDAVLSHLRSSKRPKPPTYPEAPVRIQVKSDPRKVIANDVEVYELFGGYNFRKSLR